MSANVNARMTTGTTMALVAVIVLSAICGSAAASQTRTFYNTGVSQGYSSFYDSWSGGGGCGYEQQFVSGIDYQITTAINQNEFGSGEMCGVCIQVTNVTAVGSWNTLKPFPPVPFIAFLNDLCMTCTTNQLDFFKTPQVQNNWNLEWQAVSCPVGTNKMKYQIGKGSHENWFKILPLRQANAISKIEVFANGAWASMTRSPGNGYWFYQVSGSAIQNPKVRMTAWDGEQIVDTIAAGFTSSSTSSASVVSGQAGVQFVNRYGGSAQPRVPEITTTTTTTVTTATTTAKLVAPATTASATTAAATTGATTKVTTGAATTGASTAAPAPSGNIPCTSDWQVSSPDSAIASSSSSSSSSPLMSLLLVIAVAIATATSCYQTNNF